MIGGRKFVGGQVQAVAVLRCSDSVHRRIESLHLRASPPSPAYTKGKKWDSNCEPRSTAPNHIPMYMADPARPHIKYSSMSPHA